MRTQQKNIGDKKLTRQNQQFDYARKKSMTEKADDSELVLELQDTRPPQNSKWHSEFQNGRKPFTELANKVVGPTHHELNQASGASDLDTKDPHQQSITGKAQKRFSVQKVKSGARKITPLPIQADGTPAHINMVVNPPTTIFDSESKVFKLLTSQVKPGKAIQLTVKCVGKSFVLSTCSDELLCAAKKVSGICSSNFALSLLPDDYLSRHYLVATLSSNFTGSTFKFTPLLNPTSPTSIRFVSGCSLGATDVRHMEVTLSDPLNQAKNWNLITQQPNYDPEKKVYTMNMKGCAKMASVNNTKLIESSSSQSAFMMGKESDDQYNILLWHPLTPLLGFGLALSCLTFKLIVM